MSSYLDAVGRSGGGASSKDIATAISLTHPVEENPTYPYIAPPQHPATRAYRGEVDDTTLTLFTFGVFIFGFVLGAFLL